MAGVDGISARDFDNESIIRLVKSSPDGMLVNIPFSIQQAHSGKFFFISRYEPPKAAPVVPPEMYFCGTNAVPVPVTVGP
jgi:hypothetical protein